ncbi:hypothetical protein ACH5RR_012184 [Cinchona calisaya]|uniref:Uncharacterized protein n=1 Tax=Cinchona calisaya TaxID=153742 RepID=A0ABD3A8L8_9GENT
MSRLKPNLQKSNVFPAGVHEDDYVKFSGLLGMPLGELPVTYLGLPMIPAWLNYQGCQVILVKIQQRINNWDARKMSYAGRLQLVTVVLQSIHITRQVSLFYQKRS